MKVQGAVFKEWMSVILGLYMYVSLLSFSTATENYEIFILDKQSGPRLQNFFNAQLSWAQSLFVRFVVLRPKSTSTCMVMAGRSVHLTTLLPGQAWTSGKPYLVHILSLVTDNNPSWMIQGKGGMSVEIISWSISTKVWGRAWSKTSILLKFQLQSQFQRFLCQTLCVCRKQIERNFHSVAWIMPQGWAFGSAWGGGGQKL